MNHRAFVVVSGAVAMSTLAAVLAGGTVSAAEVSSSPKMNRPVLTEEQRSLMEQAKTLRQEGKADEAKALLEKAGVFKLRPFERGAHPLIRARMKNVIRKADIDPRERQAIHDAIVNNDFATFKELVKDAPFAGKIDETAFAKIVEGQKNMKEKMKQHVPMNGGKFKHGFRMP